MIMDKNINELETRVSTLCEAALRRNEIDYAVFKTRDGKLRLSIRLPEAISRMITFELNDDIDSVLSKTLSQLKKEITKRFDAAIKTIKKLEEVE